MSVIKSMFWLYFASVIASFVRSLQNGLCNDGFCACQLEISPDYDEPTCPDWFELAYAETKPSKCMPSDEGGLEVTGLLTCLGYNDRFFANRPNASQSFGNETSSDNLTATCYVESWVVLDGQSPVIVNYTESSPPPVCALELPFTLAPTSAPASPSSAAFQVGRWTYFPFIAAAFFGASAVSEILSVGI